MAGRPKKYTKKGLEAAVEGYFASISRSVQARDADKQPLYNDAGEPIRVTEYVRPPTVGGLCLYLGIDRSTWQNYADGKLHPERAGVAARARARMECWREKREVELGGETRKAVSDGAEVRSMSIAEKVALLEEQREALAELEQETPAGDDAKPVFGFAGRPDDAAEQ